MAGEQALVNSEGDKHETADVRSETEIPLSLF
jgi:hypothetical protein